MVLRRDYPCGRLRVGSDPYGCGVGGKLHERSPDGWFLVSMSLVFFYFVISRLVLWVVGECPLWAE